MTTQVLISGYSFLELNENTDINDIDNAYSKLKDLLKDISTSKENLALTAADICDFEENNSFSLRDIIDLACGSDGIFKNEYINQLERIIGGNKSNLQTSDCLDMVKDNFPYQDTTSFAAYGATCSWPSIPEYQSISNPQDLYIFNISLLSEHYVSDSQYLNKAKNVFYNIHYHPNIIETFGTIIHGTFSNYKKIFTHALRTLHEATPLLSTAPSDHDANLQTIIDKSGELGQTLQCTKQAKNKPEFDFSLEGWEQPRMINCEFHQKINSSDDHRLPREQNVRTYFGLQNYNEEKVILLAHFGRHYE